MEIQTVYGKLQTLQGELVAHDAPSVSVPQDIDMSKHPRNCHMFSCLLKKTEGAESGTDQAICGSHPKGHGPQYHAHALQDNI